MFVYHCLFLFIKYYLMFLCQTVLVQNTSFLLVWSITMYQYWTMVVADKLKKHSYLVHVHQRLCGPKAATHARTCSYA